VTSRINGPSKLSEREDMAYHEAGHAVAAYALGCKIDGVTLAPDADYRACCLVLPPETMPVRIFKAEQQGRFYRRLTEAEQQASAERQWTRMLDIIGVSALIASHKANDPLWALPRWGHDVFFVRLRTRYGEDHMAEVLEHGRTLSRSPRGSIRYTDQVFRKAAALMAQPRNFRAVKALAAELMTRDRLDGEAATAIIRRARAQPR
jgi:DNA-binding PucR family transcriptional regulator